jgi:hypothetical protein
MTDLSDKADLYRGHSKWKHFAGNHRTVGECGFLHAIPGTTDVQIQLFNYVMSPHFLQVLRFVIADCY